jgi:hypothetical protein
MQGNDRHKCNAVDPDPGAGKLTKNLISSISKREFLPTWVCFMTHFLHKAGKSFLKIVTGRIFIISTDSIAASRIFIFNFLKYYENYQQS